MKMNSIGRSVTLVTAAIALMALPGLVSAKNSKNASKGMAKSWYVQTVVLVEDGNEMFYDDRSGVIGRIPGGEMDRDIHDIPVFQNVGGSPAAIVFTHGDDWGDSAGQYLSDYRSPGVGREVWTFSVSSNRPGAEVTLAWDGLHVITPRPGSGFDTQLDTSNPALKSLNLVDLETGEVISAIGKKGMMNSYSFIMGDRGERLFRWVQGNVKQSDRILGGAVSVRSGSQASAVNLERQSSSNVLTDGVFPAPPSVGGTTVVPVRGNPGGQADRLEQD